jgi:hypothetical protein
VRPWVRPIVAEEGHRQSFEKLRTIGDEATNGSNQPGSGFRPCSPEISPPIYKTITQAVVP